MSIKAVLDSAVVAVCVACVCGGGVTNLLITDGESRAAEVFRTVPLLVVDGKIGTLPSWVRLVMASFLFYYPLQEEVPS